MAAQDSREVACVATYLPLRHWWDVFPFLRLAAKVQQQVLESPGDIDQNTRGNPWKKTFWTISAWTDRESIRAFAAAEPHATAVRNMQRWAADGAAFAEWTQRDGTLDWGEVERRLTEPTFYYRPRNPTRDSGRP